MYRQNRVKGEKVNVIEYILKMVTEGNRFIRSFPPKQIDMHIYAIWAT